jgi:hypothetical protein
MKSSRVVRASGCQCLSCVSPGFDPNILRHSGIWGAAAEAVLNNVHRKRKKKRIGPLASLASPSRIPSHITRSSASTPICFPTPHPPSTEPQKGHAAGQNAGRPGPHVLFPPSPDYDIMRSFYPGICNFPMSCHVENLTCSSLGNLFHLCFCCICVHFFTVPKYLHVLMARL